MSIVNKIGEVVKNENDAENAFDMIIEFSFEYDKDTNNTFDVALCSIDHTTRPRFYKKFVECYMIHEAKECLDILPALKDGDSYSD